MKKRTTRSITTLTALARALQLNKSSVSKLRRRDDWPVASSPPWNAADLERVRDWRRSELQEDRARGAVSSDTLKLTRARTAAAEELALGRRRVREISEGVYHRTDECQRRIIGLIQEAKAWLLSIPNRLAPQLVGQSEPMIRAMLHDAIVAALNELAKPTAPPSPQPSPSTGGPRGQEEAGEAPHRG